MISGAFDPELLHVYVAVCRLGSFSRAAAEANRAQSALSTQIRRLEKHLGTYLLRRTGRGVEPTAEGELFLSYALRILALGDEASARLADRKAGGLVKIGIAEDLALTALPRAIGQLRRALPNLHLDIVIDHSPALATRWRDGSLDIAVGACSAFSTDPLDAWDVELCWASGIDIEIDPTTPLDVVVYAEPCEWRRMLFEALTGAGRDFRITMTSQNIAALAAGVESGLGVALLTPDCFRAATMRKITPAAGIADQIIVRYGIFTRLNQKSPLNAVSDLLIHNLCRR